jgi:hypothetical protein
MDIHHRARDKRLHSGVVIEVHVHHHLLSTPSTLMHQLRRTRDHRPQTRGQPTVSYTEAHSSLSRGTGALYQTPVRAIRIEDGFLIPLPYGSNTPRRSSTKRRRFASHSRR